MKKILFIIPPYRTCMKLTHRLYPFPVGALNLGSVLKQSGHEVEIKDFLIPVQRHKTRQPDVFKGKSAPPYLHWGQPIEKCIEWLDNNIDRFDAICLCMGQCNLFETSEILGQYIHNRKPLLIGGSFVTTHTEEAIKRTGAHVAVRGEGELVIEKAISKAIRIYRAYEKSLIIEGKKVIDADSLPLIDFSLINLEDYPKYANKIRGPISLTRGCPHGCEFCSVRKIFGRRWIRKSKERIKEELLNLWNHGVKYFVFIDDNLFYTKEIVHDITDTINKLREEIPGFKSCKFYQEEGVEVRITSDFELLSKIYNAGFENVTIGLESVSGKIRQDIKKPYNQEHMDVTIKNMKKLGKYLRAYYIVGFPDETFEDIVKDTFTIMEMGIGTRCQNLQLYPDQKMLNDFHDLGYMDKETWDWRLSPWYTPDTSNWTYRELRMLRGYINGIGKCVEVLGIKPLTDTKEELQEKFLRKHRTVIFKKDRIEYEGNMYNSSYMKNLFMFLIIKDGYKGAKVTITGKRAMVCEGLDTHQNKLQETLYNILFPEKENEKLDLFF